MNTKHLIKIILSILPIPFIVIPKAYAACPVCTIAVGGMMVLLEKYGVDNTISGVWIGGFVLSTTLWAMNWLTKKGWKFPLMGPLLLLFFYLSLIAPLQLKGIIGIQSKMMWGADKAILGMLIGGMIFHFTHISYLKIKQRNGGHAWFPFQRVVMPLLSLTFTSLIFYLLSSPKYLWHDVKGYVDTPILWILIPVALVNHLLLFQLLNQLEQPCH